MKLLHKVLLYLLLFPAAYCLLPASVFAQQEFNTAYQTTYEVKQNGDAEVTHEITLTNNLSTIYATSYAFTIDGDKPENINASQHDTQLATEISKEGQKTKMVITFPDAIVGKGKTRNFAVRYSITKFATQNGQVWELEIPKVAATDEINTYELALIVPKTFGKPAYISPQPKNTRIEEQLQIFTFGKEDLTRAGGVAAFGDSQVFSFDLTYHLQNPYSDRHGQTDIALVPDTAFQRVYYELLEPKPADINLDSDGNWLASYLLAPSQTLEVRTQGTVQLFTAAQDNYPKVNPIQKGYYLSQTAYWQTADSEIVTKAASLPTARKIYDFVTSTLNYDYDRVREGAERLGAKKALSQPDDAVCMEFTDLFITLARASGIPAREINGYAYTENPEIQPLSLVADVLHAWPEFWDEGGQYWRPVDPTWGNTTGGVDFFDKFDLAHITFAIHGQDPQWPPPAGSYKAFGNPQKDVQVAFGKLPQDRVSNLQIKFFPKELPLSVLLSKVLVEITNPGPIALYDQDVAVYGAGVNAAKVAGGNSKTKIDFLAPFSNYQLEVVYQNNFDPAKLFAKDNTPKITVSIGPQTTSWEIPKTHTQILALVAVFAVLTTFVGITFLVARFRLIQKVKQLAETVIK